MKGFKIELNSEDENDRSRNYYLPGEVINGRVIIESDHEEKMTGIKLKWIGRARVKWAEYVVSDNNHLKTYTAEEYYFNHKTYIFGSEGGPEIILSPGSKSFSFTFLLPPRIPSSFKGEHGSVKYFLTVVVKRNRKLNRKIKLPFVVHGSLDLNLNPSAYAQDICSKSTRLGWLCWKSGPIGFNFKMDRCGFVPGEFILFTAELYNFSSRHVRKTKVNLVKVCTYKGDEKSTHSDPEIIAKKRGPPIRPGEIMIWDCSQFGMEIPQTPPTNLAGCKIIDVRYSIQVIIKLPRFSCQFDVCENIPVIIGTVPLQNNIQCQDLDLTVELDSTFLESYSYNEQRFLRTNRVASSIELVPLLSQQDNMAAPPSYEKVMEMFPRVNNENTEERPDTENMENCPPPIYCDDFERK